MLERYRPSGLFSILAYDSDHRLFFHEDGYLSFGFVANPHMNPNDPLASQLQVLLQMDWPKDSLMQVCLWASPDIEETLLHAEQMRKTSSKNDALAKGEAFKGRALASELVTERLEFLRRHTEEPLPGHGATRFRDIRTLFIFKIPTGKDGPSDAQFEAVGKLRFTAKGALTSAGFYPVSIDPERYLRIVGSAVNWGSEARWKNSAAVYSNDQLIREQLFDPESSIEVAADGLRIGRKYVKTLCVKRYPESVHLVQSGSFLGDLRTGTRGIPGPILISLNIAFPAADEIRAALATKRTAAQYQADGALARYAPRMREQSRSLNMVFEHVDGGDRIVKAYLSFVVFADTEEEIAAASTNVITYFREIGYSVQADTFIALPVFLNALPFGVEQASIAHLFRYRTMATIHAAHMMPCVSDWKGTGTPTCMFSTRNGSVMSFDFFDSPTNYSAVIAGESGSGKSLLVQSMMKDYISLGALVFVIEVGRSFKNTCHVLGGDHMEFRRNDALSINPFSTIVDYNDQADLLLATILAMVSPTGAMSDFQIAVLRKVLKETWDEYGHQGTIDLLAAALLDYRTQDDSIDSRVTDMGMQLYAFTSEGEYGAWFNSPATIRFSNPLTVCELVDLKERAHLQKVVLVQLISVIQRAMYLGDTETPKLLIIDEGWDLITGGAEGKFIERGARQLRKHKGGAWLILQSVQDLYRNETGAAFAENSAHKILLGQTAEAIDNLVDTGKLSLGPGAASVLKSVHTRKGVGAYSEFFLYTRNGGGIARLIIDRFEQLMFSTHPQERAELEKRLKAGMTVHQAIAEMIAIEHEVAAVGA